jgi:6-pyruvoyltetrahydropterin/6-carboxytetrahydropterin synthase
VSFEIGVVTHFTARHHLVGDFGPASESHEHTYRVEASISGVTLREDGTFLDITILQAALAEATSVLEGADLNVVPGMAEPNPTAEVVARYLSDIVVAHLPLHGLRRLETRVWESADAWATYTRELS